MEPIGTNDNHIKLIVMVRAHWSMPDGGPKTYRRRESLTTVVDSQNYSVLQLVNFIGESFLWGSKQYISLWRALEDESIEISTNEQLFEWFELNKDKGEVHIVGQVNDFDGPLQFSPTKRRLHPTVRNLPSTAPIDLDPFIDPTQPTQPTQPAKEDKKVHRKVSDEVLSDSSYDSELASSSDSELDAFSDSNCSDPEYEPDHEIVDDDDNDDVPICSYDVDAPCVDVGCLFPDVNQCKSALTQHAILNDYGFRTVKKDNGRFRAKCFRADQGCEWTFFASTSKKNFVGCKVKTNGPKHKCSSVNQCGDTMATNNWVAERVVEFLLEDSTMGPMELQRRLKKKYGCKGLGEAIGTPTGLAISTDACKGLGEAMKDVYPGVEHRECMRHLWKNFKKHYSGDLFNYNMWPAAKACTIEKFNWHMERIMEKCPAAIAYLDENHPYLWSRSKFSDQCKVDYINNNISESFNNWVRRCKDLQILEMHDMIRQMIISKFEERRKNAMSLEGNIIPDITKALTDQSKAIKDHEVLRCGNNTAEVTAPTSSGAAFRYAVNLELKTCSCRLWQVSGKPCKHALAFIAKLSREVQMDDFVHDYFSIEKLRKAYTSVFNPMTSKHFWPRVDLGYKINKPKLRRKPGRPRKTRIKASDEPGARKRKRCSECGELGHTAKKCQGGLTAREKKMFASHENASEVESNDPPTTGSSNDAASNIGGGSQIGRSGGTSSSHIETANDGATDVRGGRPPTGRGRGRGRGRGGRGRGRGGSRLAALLNVYN